MKLLMALVVTLALVGPVAAQDLVIYPSRNQSNEQMEKDKLACHSWAKGETGFDPMARPEAVATDRQSSSVAGGAARGGVGGLAVGTGIGAIAGGGSGAGRGAAIGALTGGTLGGLRSSSQNREARREQQRFEDEQAAQQEKGRKNFDRAFAACLEGRGYTVR